MSVQVETANMNRIECISSDGYGVKLTRIRHWMGKGNRHVAFNFPESNDSTGIYE
jgi:hypothetical protein